MKINQLLQIDPKKAERRDGKMFVGGILAETTDQTIKVKIVGLTPAGKVTNKLVDQFSELKLFLKWPRF